MTVYAVFEIQPADHPSAQAITDYEAYRDAVPELIERFGGRYLVRAGHGRALEGPDTGGRWHLIEFADAASAQRFWNCPEYAALKPLRAGAADVRAVLVEPPA